jgi:hypothetical protein
MRNTETRSGCRGWKITGLTSFIVLMIGGAAAMSIASVKPAIDETNLCRRDAKLDTSTAIIVDTTDALTQNQLRQLRAAIHNARDDLAAGAKLTLLFLEASASYEPRELVSMCNPGTSASANPMFVTARRIDKRWKDSFGQPIDEAINWLGSAPAAEASPIIETITAATQRPDFDRRVLNRKLVIVSDLLQYQAGSGGYSQYQKSDLWQSYQRSRLAIEARADLTNAAVEIVYLARPNMAQFQSPQHRAFWRQWFTQAGASSVHFIGVPEDAVQSAQEPARPGAKHDSAPKKPKVAPAAVKARTRVTPTLANR